MTFFLWILVEIIIKKKLPAISFKNIFFCYIGESNVG